MDKKQLIIVFTIVILIAGSLSYFMKIRPQLRSSSVKQISVEKEEYNAGELINSGPVSPISGLSCDHWNRRPVAIMQPADIQARPAAGLSEADMVIEMPAYTASVTRLMGVYLCNLPEDIGAMRSARHDYIHLAKGLDATFFHWGGSAFAYNKLNQGVVDNVDCMSSPYCDRWERKGLMRVEDTGHITGENVIKALESKNYRTEGKFPGYPHQIEAPISERPESGHLRVAFAKPYDVEYDYDRESNSYLRTWGEDEDFDRNNNKRIAPKNIVVMFARSEQVTIDQQYESKGLESPWSGVPEIKSTGVESISGRYNNVLVGDPWYDDIDSGEARYYLNGNEYRGEWKKNKNDINSKLYFYDENGQEMKFVPGQIWVEILEPGQALRWETGNENNSALEEEK